MTTGGISFEDVIENINSLPAAAPRSGQSLIVYSGRKLAPAEWNSGDRLWLVEQVAPFGGQEAMIADLKAASFQGKSFKMLVTDAGGKKTVVGA